MAAHDPFAPLLRRRRWSARRDRWWRTLTRPLRPTRLAPRRGGRPGLLLVAVDTLRADHAFSPETAPALQRLAATGLTCRRVQATAPWTLPSFASALTGLAPCRHGAGMRGAVRNMAETPPAHLAGGVTTLAQHLADHGYATAAVVANPFVGFGLERGFQWYRYRNHDAADVAAAGLDWIRAHGDRPFFCFLLLNDPHEPTLPPPDLLADELRRAGRDPAAVAPRVLRALAAWGDPAAGVPHLGRHPDPDDPALADALALKRILYRAAVRHVDAVLQRLLAVLERWGLADTTLVSVISDHGEEFREHAAVESAWDHDPRGLVGIGHGHTLFGELLHVPWIARGPDLPAGTELESPLSLMDVAPSLCRWLDVPELPLAGHPAWLTGRALDPAAPAAAGEPLRLLPAENIAYGPDLVAVSDGRWRLTAPRDGERALRLSDLADDPAETRDHQTTAPAERDRLLAAVRRWREETGGDGGTGGPGWEAMSARVRRQLEELGYA